MDTVASERRGHARKARTIRGPRSSRAAWPTFRTRFDLRSARRRRWKLRERPSIRSSGWKQTAVMFGLGAVDGAVGVALCNRRSGCFAVCGIGRTHLHRRASPAADHLNTRLKEWLAQPLGGMKPREQHKRAPAVNVFIADASRMRRRSNRAPHRPKTGIHF